MFKLSADQKSELIWGAIIAVVGIASILIILSHVAPRAFPVPQ